MVVLRQAYSIVTGVYVLKQGRIHGQATDDMLAGKRSEAPSCAPPNDAGDFEMHMDRSGSSFKGKWWKPGSAKEHESLRPVAFLNLSTSIHIG